MRIDTQLLGYGTNLLPFCSLGTNTVGTLPVVLELVPIGLVVSTAPPWGETQEFTGRNCWLLTVLSHPHCV